MRPKSPPLANATVKKRVDTADARCRGTRSQGYPAMFPDFLTARPRITAAA
jgi:hypothetical protein